MEIALQPGHRQALELYGKSPGTRPAIRSSNWTVQTEPGRFRRIANRQGEVQPGEVRQGHRRQGLGGRFEPGVQGLGVGSLPGTVSSLLARSLEQSQGLLDFLVWYLNHCFLETVQYFPVVETVEPPAALSKHLRHRSEQHGPATVDGVNR